MQPKTWATVSRKNVGESDIQERGRKVICKIHPDTPLPEPINMGTNSSAMYETSETLTRERAQLPTVPLFF